MAGFVLQNQKIHTIIEIQDQQNDPFERAQKQRDAGQDKKIDKNSKKIEKLQGNKK